MSGGASTLPGISTFLLRRPPPRLTKDLARPLCHPEPRRRRGRDLNTSCPPPNSSAQTRPPPQTADRPALALHHHALMPASRQAGETRAKGVWGSESLVAPPGQECARRVPAGRRCRLPFPIPLGRSRETVPTPVPFVPFCVPFVPLGVPFVPPSVPFGGLFRCRRAANPHIHAPHPVAIEV